MEYTVKKLGQIAGVTTRTLRYYDEIDLLKPARINSSGYRIYGEKEVDILQQILFYKELGLDLNSIKEIIRAPSFDRTKALKEHKEKLIKKRNRLDLLISNVNKTIDSAEGGRKMLDQEKFEGFKDRLINDNEEKYGKEIRQKYGDDTISKSNQKLRDMTKEEYNKMTKLEEDMLKMLGEAFKGGDPSSQLAQKAADLHRQWLSHYWPKYSKEAHAGLAEMYLDDERFTTYYDAARPGTAAFLRDAILVYTGVKQ